MINELRAAYEAATPRRFEVLTGANVCFHPGNTVAVVAIYDSNPDEVMTPTVAEFWPSSDGVDLADANLYALMHNNLPALLEAVEALQNLVGAVETGESADYRALQGHRAMREARSALAKLKGEV